jgi:hypothetical protein
MQARLRRDAVTLNQPRDTQANMWYALQNTIQYQPTNEATINKNIPCLPYPKVQMSEYSTHVDHSDWEDNYYGLLTRAYKSRILR